MRRLSRHLILGLAVLGIAASASASQMEILFMGDPTQTAITETNGQLNGFTLNLSWLDATSPLYPSHIGTFVHGSLTVAGDGTISAVGDIYGLNLLDTPLLSGTISGYAWGQNQRLTIWGTDTKTPALLGALGFPSDQSFSDFSLLIDHVGPNMNEVVELSNTAVPEPSSLLFLGSGFLGLARVVRRRLGC